jgi:hypothetical protein
MGRTYTILTVGVLLGFLSTVAVGDDDWGAVSIRLSPGMTEQEIMKAVGYRPNKAEVKTCGGNTRDGGWMCKVYTFGYAAKYLQVVFSEASSGVWIANSWSVYP